MSMPPAPPPPCAVAVSHSEGVNQFEAPFVDPVNRTKMTRTFFLFEPVLYQPSHLAQAVLTHISFITKEYFVVAASTTERTIPCSLAQSVLKFKLTLEDVERELHGKGLSAGERIVWRRWVEEQNSREGRRSRLRAPCCGRSTFRYKLVPTERGFLACKECADGYNEAVYAANYWAHYYPQPVHYNDDTDTSSQEAVPEKRVAPPPWRMPPAKRQTVEVMMSPEELNATLLGTQP